MVEVINTHKIVETIEREKVDTSPIKRKSYARSYRGHLMGCIQKCKNDNNIELQKLYEEELKIFNSFYPEKIVRVEILQGYKNKYEKASLGEFYRDLDDNIHIRVWHREGYESKIIKKGAIGKIIAVLNSLQLGEVVSCYKMAFKLGYGDTEKQAWKNLWKDRMDEYFPNYYSPILFLQELKYIEYDRKGNIKRIR